MNFVHLRSFDNYVQANIQLGMLQDLGINCHLQDEYTITIDPLLSNAIGGMKLMVFDTQVSRALSILEQTEKNGDDDQASLPTHSFGEPDQAQIDKGPRLLQKLNDIFGMGLLRKGND
jgi:hypothetical protein